MPPGSVFNKDSAIKAEPTKLGMQYSLYKTVDCPKGSILQETFNLVELYDYDTIWNKAWKTPRIVQGSSSEIVFCNQNPSIYTNIFFFFKKVYTRSSRYPDSIFDGLTKIGGLLAIFRIGILLSFLH